MSCVLFSSFAIASAPTYFNEQIENEYRALVVHMRDMLPETKQQLVYLPSFYPFSLLDIRPTKLESDEDKQDFANFNFGVLGSAFLNINVNQLSKLPSISICKEQECKTERIQKIREFLSHSFSDIQSFRQNSGLYIVQQTTPLVYRINNTFYSPTQLITYYPSEIAGFVPSGNYRITRPEDESNMMDLSRATEAIRDLMAKYQIAAITKIDEGSINVIFGGMSDNHWGVVLYNSLGLPGSGTHNHLGLKYDIIEKISEDSFYYQTN